MTTHKNNEKGFDPLDHVPEIARELALPRSMVRMRLALDDSPRVREIVEQLRERYAMDDAHHIRAANGSPFTLCGGSAKKLNTLPADTTVWPDKHAACWTCWDVRREALVKKAPGV